MEHFINIIKYGFLLLLTGSMHAQFVGTPYIVPIDDGLLLDKVGVNPSFAFSTRKLRKAYTGPALRLYKATDGSTADVYFDTNGVVTDASRVNYSTVGTSGATAGQNTTLAAYRGASPVYVNIWWDQSTNYYNGNQGSIANRPLFVLNSAGATNQYPSVQFTGTSRHHVAVAQTLTTLLGNALRASIGIIAKPTTPTTANNSFGYFDTSVPSKRWSCHLNWPDGNCYTDFGNASDLNRNFVNSSRQGVYKQYTMIRGDNYKTVKISGAFIQNAVQQNQTTPLVTGGNFGVGVTTGGLNTENGFFGNIAEFVLFKEPLTAAQVTILENNQISFWDAN
jgi:hypothetical protein